MREPLLQRFLSGGALATLAATALVLGSPRVEPASADAAQVTVVSPGGRGQTIALEALAGAENLQDRPYALRSAGGEETRPVTGFSLASVLDSAGADPFGFSYLEVQRPAGGTVVLSRHQALDEGAFADGPPAVYATPAGTGFLRPSTGTGDLNADDSFEAPQGLTISLRSGSPLKVRATASRRRVRPGQEVEFEALVERSGSGEEPEYSWYFDDGGSATSPTASHSFSRRGSYDVVVGVTTPGDRAGASAVVRIQVGAPISGPDRKGGGRRRAGNAPDHGAASDTRGATPPRPASGQGDADGPERPTTKAIPPREPDRSRPTPPDRATRQGVPVSGRLLHSPRTRAFTSPPAPAPGARRGALRETGGGGGVPGVALGGIAVLALLGTGALLEGGAIPGASGWWRRWPR